MFDFHLMLQVKLPVVDRIQRQSTKSSNGVENKATGDSSPEDIHIFFLNKVKSILVWFIVNFQVEAKTTSKHVGEFIIKPHSSTRWRRRT